MKKLLWALVLFPLLCFGSEYSMSIYESGVPKDQVRAVIVDLCGKEHSRIFYKEDLDSTVKWEIMITVWANELMISPEFDKCRKGK